MTELQQLLKGKTPVSLLQEICSKKKLTPTYNILANEGPVHEPVFVMSAQAGGFQGTGKGPSKKKAKHNAATYLLCEMHGIKYEIEDESVGAMPSSNNGNAEPTGNGIPEHAAMSAGVFDGDMQGNPIGDLQEYTQKNLLRPPQYQFIGEQGPPHAREFVCTVKLAKLSETAVGKSKKIAKRAAASKLLQSVRQHQSDSSSSPIQEEEEDELPLLSNPMVLFKKEIHTLTGEGGRKATEFFDNLKRGSKAPGSARALQGPLSTNADFVDLLHKLGKEKKFDVRYMPIESKSYSGQYQCLVQISTGPIAVCHGYGASAKEAKAAAAHHALQYLKLMTAEP